MCVVSEPVVWDVGRKEPGGRGSGNGITFEGPEEIENTKIIDLQISRSQIS